MEECTAAFHNRIEIAKFELNEVQQKIEDLKKKIAASVEANKRAEELKNKSDFYKLNISDIDKQEIKKLREVEPYLRNSEPLNKVIWKCYYENPTTDLIGRVIGSGVHTGIYKITNLENQMCYIGQAVNIGR